MDELVLANINADVAHPGSASGGERNDVASLKLVLRHGCAELCLFSRSSRERDALGMTEYVAHKARAIEAAGALTAPAVSRADVARRFRDHVGPHARVNASGGRHRSAGGRPRRRSCRV